MIRYCEKSAINLNSVANVRKNIIVLVDYKLPETYEIRGAKPGGWAVSICQLAKTERILQANTKPYLLTLLLYEILYRSSKLCADSTLNFYVN